MADLIPPVQVTFDVATQQFTIVPSLIKVFPPGGTIDFNLMSINGTASFDDPPITFPDGGPFTIINQTADTFQLQDTDNLTSNDPAQTFSYIIHAGRQRSSSDPVIVNEPPAGTPVG